MGLLGTVCFTCVVGVVVVGGVGVDDCDCVVGVGVRDNGVAGDGLFTELDFLRVEREDCLVCAVFVRLRVVSLLDCRAGLLVAVRDGARGVGDAL
jgi:hypothetical protein